MQGAAQLGAQYVGFIFAGGPRNLTVERAKELTAATPHFVKKVGVFRTNSASEIAAFTEHVPLDVIQLHGDPESDDVVRVQKVFDGEVWPVIRVEGGILPTNASRLFETSDVVVLDTKVKGMLGGTGHTLPWHNVAEQLNRLRRAATRISLAGGLNPGNVGDAIAALAPDIIDVSSGIESSPGIKSYDKMKQFMEQVNDANIGTR